MDYIEKRLLKFSPYIINLLLYYFATVALGGGKLSELGLLDEISESRLHPGIHIEGTYKLKSSLFKKGKNSSGIELPVVGRLHRSLSKYCISLWGIRKCQINSFFSSILREIEFFPYFYAMAHILKTHLKILSDKTISK